METSPRSSEADLDLRYELKLVCDSHMLAQAATWIQLHPAGFIVAYPSRRVNSIYLDTLQMSSLCENMAGIGTRQKLRLRWYGNRMTDVRPVLELKQKHNLLGRKKQYLLPCVLDLTAPWVEILNEVRVRVGPDWHALLQTMDYPTLIAQYQRQYYRTPDSAIRVTLDYAQKAYDQRLSPHPNLSASLPIADKVIIEIKASADHADQLEEIAGQFPMQRVRNSKYVGGLLTALG